MRTGRLAGMGVAAAGLLLVGACGAPDNTYIENADAGMFLRLPAEWTVFPSADGDPSGDPRVDLDFGGWRVLFDGSEEPSRTNVEADEPSSPVGFAEIVPAIMLSEALGAQEISSHADLRSSVIGFGGDPLDTEIGGPDVLDYEEFDLGSFWGNRITIEIEALGAHDLRMTQLSFTDEHGSLLYAFRVLCTVECYEDNEAAIDAVLDSFTLKA